MLNQLRIAVADHISEALIAAKVPLQVLIDTATNKSNDELENYAQSFSDDAESILQVQFNTAVTIFKLQVRDANCFRNYIIFI